MMTEIPRENPAFAPETDLDQQQPEGRYTLEAVNAKFDELVRRVDEAGMSAITRSKIRLARESFTTVVDSTTLREELQEFASKTQDQEFRYALLRGGKVTALKMLTQGWRGNVEMPDMDYLTQSNFPYPAEPEGFAERWILEQGVDDDVAPELKDKIVNGFWETIKPEIQQISDETNAKILAQPVVTPGVDVFSAAGKVADEFDEANHAHFDAMHEALDSGITALEGKAARIAAEAVGQPALVTSRWFRRGKGAAKSDESIDPTQTKQAEEDRLLGEFYRGSAEFIRLADESDVQAEESGADQEPTPQQLAWRDFLGAIGYEAFMNTVVEAGTAGVSEIKTKFPPDRLLEILSEYDEKIETFWEQERGFYGVGTESIYAMEEQPGVNGGPEASIIPHEGHNHIGIPFEHPETGQPVPIDFARARHYINGSTGPYWHDAFSDLVLNRLITTMATRGPRESAEGEGFDQQRAAKAFRLLSSRFLPERVPEDDEAYDEHVEMYIDFTKEVNLLHQKLGEGLLSFYVQNGFLEIVIRGEAAAPDDAAGEQQVA